MPSRADHPSHDGPAAHGDARRNGPGRVLRVATYNVHRWTGLAGGTRWTPELAMAVIEELKADVIALQEVLRPYFHPDPLLELAGDLGFHLVFAPSRVHRRGMLGNAILARWPMQAVQMIDLSYSRVEQRSAVAGKFLGPHGDVAVVATHLALVDRTRRHQVRSLLDHPQLQGTTILLGDMNAWRRCRATRELDREFTTRHDNQRWPPSFPASRPVLALDRIYARGARIAELRPHLSPASKRGSDHLPIVARIVVDEWN